MSRKILRGHTSRQPSAAHPVGALHSCDAGAILFVEGAPKTAVFRILSGQVRLFTRVGPTIEVIGTAKPGEILGLGFLEHHTHTAQVIRPTCVEVFALEAVPALIKSDPSVGSQQAAATHREFEARRKTIVATLSPSPLRRLAALLVALSGLNAREGRNPLVIPGEVSCGEVAQNLGVDIDTLARLLLDLKKQGLVEARPPVGLYVTDLSGLQRFAGEPAHARGPRTGLTAAPPRPRHA